MLFLDNIWLIPLLPAFGAAMMFFFGKKLRKQTVSAICVGMIAIAFVMSCGAVWQYTNYAHGTGMPFEKTCTHGWARAMATWHFRARSMAQPLNSRPKLDFFSTRSPPSGYYSSPESACSSISIPLDTWPTKAVTTASSGT